MNHGEAMRPAGDPKVSRDTKSGRLETKQKAASNKPTGPVTYKVSKGSNVFWSGKGPRSK